MNALMIQIFIWFVIDGTRRVVVIGDGKLIVPVDFAVRRHDPKEPGAGVTAN